MHLSLGESWLLSELGAQSGQESPIITAMQKKECEGKFTMILEDQNLRRRKKGSWVEKSQELLGLQNYF